MNTVDKPPQEPKTVEKPRVPGASIADVWRVPVAIWRARRAVDSGDLGTARRLVAPLLGRFGTVTPVRKIAGEVLYASGDPLSAAALFEQAAKKLRSDSAIAVGLVASYAALNRAGDARRSAQLLPDHVDVRLALAWSELVAIGGDREAGALVVADVARDPDLAASTERRAMHHALTAIAAARSDRRDEVTAAIARVDGESARLRVGDRAFLAYLCGVALREAGRTNEARARFDEGVALSPSSIGGALALRERANLDR
jgi:hypothetical protein